MKRKRPCPVDGCQCMREARLPFCDGHWHSLTSTLRTRIWHLMQVAPCSDSAKKALREARGLLNLHEASRRRRAQLGPVERGFAS